MDYKNLNSDFLNKKLRELDIRINLRTRLPGNNNININNKDKIINEILLIRQQRKEIIEKGEKKILKYKEILKKEQEIFSNETKKIRKEEEILNNKYLKEIKKLKSFKISKNKINSSLNFTEISPENIL